MMIPFAKNQVMVGDSTAVATTYTDSISLGDLDRAFVIFDCHSIHGTGADITYTLEVSNDGVTFTAPSAAFTQNATSAPLTQKKVGDIEGAFLRVKLELTLGSGAGGAIFDILVNLDKA